MLKPFSELRERLLRAGVAPRHVRRYLGELADHFDDLRTEEERAGRSRTDAESAALNRLGGIDALARAMISQRQFQSLSARAAWAAFAITPVILLTMAYLVAGFILVTGWALFLPGSETPFVPVRGFAAIYFGVGRWIYFYAPVLIGWAIGLLAARQRSRAIWPAVGLLLIACIGGTTAVHTARTTSTSVGIGHFSGTSGSIHMDLANGAQLHNSLAGLPHVLLILALTAMPYLIWQLLWRFRHARSVSA